MGFSVSWLVALACLFCMGGEVRCNCTEENVQIDGGTYKLTKQLNTNSLLIYSCPEGYYPYPALTRLCQPNGTWKPAPRRRQRCKLVECPDPNVMENGDVSPPQEKYFVSNETTYECYSGYTFRGSSRRVCLPNGKWSGSTPICSRDSGHNCADPGIPAGATRTGNMFGIGDTVTYSCTGDQFLVGPGERVCQENGEWTGKEPACYYKHTFDTPLEVSKAFFSTLKDRLTATESDEEHDGRKIKISKNETLNIYIAVDTSASIESRDIENAKNAVAKLISKISSFSVSPNYEILLFSCDIVKVANILDFWDGKISLETIMRTINLEDHRTIETDDSSQGSDLRSVFRNFLEQMLVMKQRVGEEAFKAHRHIIIIFTDGAYTVGDPAATVEKIKDLVYMRHTSGMETQSREEYLDIYIFGIGAEIFDEDLQVLTVGTGGKHYFRMNDLHNLQETFDDIIDEEAVVGLCGLHKKYESPDRDNYRRMYPWVAFIYIQNIRGIRKCIGSLVTPQFVLTAANCLKFGDLPNDITVEIDDGLGRVKSVKTFYIHPLYNTTVSVRRVYADSAMILVEPVQGKPYDYDVALIQLQEDVQISSAARPICIPCTQETSDALKLVGVSTCRDQEQLLFKNHIEKLSFLTKTRSRLYEKDVHAKLGDNRDACIRHALQAEGVTTNNPKEAVTDNFLCTGGRIPFRDHIACKGDAGGAVFKNYEHRTIQVAVVSWGTKTLCKEGSLMESDDTSRDFHFNLFKAVPFLKSILGNDNQDDFVPLRFLDD